MFKQIIKQSSLAGMGTGLTATGRIPTNGTLYEIWLKFDGTVAQTKSELSNIVVRADGEELINATPTFLLDLEKYYGDCEDAGNVAGLIPLRFYRPHLPTDSERSLYGLGLSNIDQLTVDVECGTLSAISACQMWAIMTPEQRVMGQHVRIHKFPNSFATTGEQEVSELPKGLASQGYLSIHIEDNAGTIDDVTVKKGGYSIFDKVPADINNSILKHHHRTRQTGYYHVDFSVSDDLQGFIPMANVKDWRLTITWSSAAPTTYNIYTERIFGLNVAKK